MKFSRNTSGNILAHKPLRKTDKLTTSFRQAEQRAAEGVEAFVIMLRTLAADCEFGSIFDDESRLREF
jgi:hypothetical protein